MYTNMNTITLSVYTAATSQRFASPPPLIALPVFTIEVTLATTCMMETTR